MFKTGDYVKFGKRGQVVYMVEVIGVEDTVMIRKTGPGRNRLQSAIKVDRLVHVYPAGAKLDESIAAVKAEQAEELAKDKTEEQAVAEVMLTPEPAKVEDETPAWDYAAPIGPDRPFEWAIDRVMTKAVTESRGRQKAVAKGIDRAMTKGRAPRGAQATRYGQAMREALAKKNGSRVKSPNVRYQHTARVKETDK